MAVQVGWSGAESRGAQAGARVGTGMAGMEADATGVGAEAVLSGLAAKPVPSRLALPARVWRSWLRHWLRYPGVVGAQWR